MEEQLTLFEKTNKQVNSQTVVVGDSPKSKIQIIKPINTPVLGYTYGYGRGSFTPPEYNLAEIGRVEDVENMVRQAFKRKIGLMFKAGYDFVGKNKDTVRYIKERFRQIQEAADIPTQILLRNIGSDLIRLSNVYVIKVRNEKSSGGKKRKNKNGKFLNPVAAYFIIPAETVEIKKNEKTSKIEIYRQKMPDGRFKDFPASDVIHIYYDKRPGFNIGKPTIVPVIDDIRALRRIEQNIELLIYQHLFPLFHHKVGTKDQPEKIYTDGTKEVDEIRDQIQYMPSEGSIVTSFRHEITSIGAESRAIRAEGYLEHFKKRVVAGLGISAIDLGEGDTANRSTSETMSRSIIDDVKDFQQTLSTYINEYIVKELLLESTFSFDVLDEQNMVNLQFNEIDVDSKIKVENHMIHAFQGHAVTETELRNVFGKEGITDAEREDMYVNRVTKTTAEFEASLNPTTTGGSRAAASIDQPSNQHGQKSGPGSLKNVTVNDSILREEFKDVIVDLEQSVITGTFSIDWAVQLLSSIETRIVERLIYHMNKELRRGVEEFIDLHEVRLGHPYQRIEEYANFRIHSIIENIKRIIKSFDVSDSNIAADIKKLYESLAFRFDFIMRTEKRRAYLYGKGLAYKQEGIKSVKVDVGEDSCKQCQRNKDKVIQLGQFSIDDVPIAHDNCECDIKKIL